MKFPGILQETPILDPGVIYSLFETSTPEVLAQIVPLLAEKGADFKESGKLGRAIFLKQKLPLLTVSLKKYPNLVIIR